MQDFVQWLATSQISQVLQKAPWIIALIQVVHILAIAIVLSAVLMFQLQLFGWSKYQSARQIAHRYGPWLWTGLAVLAATGILLIVAEPKRTLINNTAFQLKMVLLAIVVLIALLFQIALRYREGYLQN